MDMKEAYDLKMLGDKLKENGLELAEDAAGIVYKCVKEWVKDSAVKSSTPYDNVAIIVMDQLDAVVLPQIDKIDGEEG